MAKQKAHPERQSSGGPSALLSVALTVVVAIAAVGGIFGLRYLSGTWAPSRDGEGLQFPETPVLVSAGGKTLSAAETNEFVRLCSSLRDTTRAIGEEKGSPTIVYRLSESRLQGVLTIFPRHRVVFSGTWLDAKSYGMVGERVPCHPLTSEFLEFVERHALSRAEED